MSWFVRDLPGVDLQQAALGLVEFPGAFLARDEECWLAAAWPVERSLELDPEPGLVAQPGASVPRWLGLLPYEAFRRQERVPLELDHRPPALVETCEWHRYEAVAVQDRAGARVEGDDKVAVERLARVLLEVPTPQGQRASLALQGQSEPAAAHEARIRTALARIAAGRLYQVNLARRVEFSTSGHPIELLLALGDDAQAPYSLALSWGELGVVSGSPELFLDVAPGGRVETRPIKGTRPRGRTPQEDLALRVELDQSEKEQAELTMVIDIERNDLGRLAEIGSVHVSRAPHVVTHRTVHHREAAVVAQLRPGVTRSELLRATMPSGSVTGAPKVGAMDLIRELEPVRRGLYTGALGTLGHDGRLRLSMAIRVLVTRGSVAHYFAGGGIVAESDPAAEVLETAWKTRLLGRLLALDAEN